MNEIFAVILLICPASATPCGPHNAIVMVETTFENAGNSESPCSDFLFQQTEWDVEDASGAIVYYSCKRQ